MKNLTPFLWIIIILLSFDIQAQQLTRQISYSVNNVDVQQVDGYDVINLANAMHLEDEDIAGNPQLPVITINLLLPQGAAMTGVSINVGQESQLAGSFNLFPAQPPSYPDFSESLPFVQQKTSVYNSNDPFPEESLLSYEVHGFRDYTYISISYIPFRYIPASGELYLASELTLTVNYTSNPPAEPYKQRSYNHQDEAAYRYIQKTVANTADLDTFYPAVVAQLDTWRNAGVILGRQFETTDLPSPYGSRVEYVIITNNTDISGTSVGDFTGKFQEFAEWKTQSGTPAKVVTVDVIRQNYPGLDVPEQIRRFIQEAHELWGTEYILLGGSAKIIPVRWIKHSQDMPTDLYYSAIFPYEDNWNANGNHLFGQNTTGNTAPDYADYTADIAIGRAPVGTESQVDLFLHKNFTYTRNSLASNIPNGTWLGKQLGGYGACFNTPWNGTGLKVGFEIIQAHHNNIDIYGMFEYNVDWNNSLSNYYRPDWCYAYYDTDPNACTDNQVVINDENQSHAGFLSQINQGFGLINVLDHGGPYRIGLRKVTHLPGLSMQDFQNLPDTGKYGIFLAGGCHTAAIEREGYIGERWLNSPGGGVGYYGASASIFATPSYHFNKQFFNSLHSEGVFKQGWLHSYTAQNAQTSSSYQNYLLKIFQLLGDPDLSVYTETPTNLAVTHASTIANGNQDFQVNVSGFPVGNTVKVSLYKEGEVLAYTETDDFPVTFNITPDTTGDLYVTATSRNKEPYEAAVSVTQFTGTHLYKSNLSFTDANGNGIIEPGESVDITFDLSNTGATDATNISAQLTVIGTNTQVTQNTSGYNDIASGQTGNSLVSYTFTASDEDNLRAIPFELVITTAQGTFTEPFLMPLSRAQLEPGNRSTLVNGVETSTFAPNDIVQLYMDIRNTGQVTAEAVNAELATTLPANIASVTNSTFVYGNIEPGEELTNTTAFTVEIGSGYTGGALIFELTLTDAFGVEKIFEIDLAEALPPLISGFDYTSSNNHITPIWNPVQQMGGYHIYRSDTETGVFERVNDMLVTTASTYTDLSVSPLSEYWYKISVVSPTGNELPLAALVAYPANTTLGGHGGFPIQTNPGAARSARTSPIAYDINGDGKKEIFLTQSNEHQFNIPSLGRIMAFYESGEELFDIDGNATEVWGFAETLLASWSSPAIGDIDNNGQAEVFAIGRDNTANAGVLYGFRTVDTNNDNKPDLLWNNTFLPGQINIGHRTLRNPVLADLNSNGYLEIIILDEKQRISIYDRNKNLLGQKQLGNTDWAEGEIAVADVDGDGYKEIVVGFKEVTTGRGAVYIWDHNGNFSTNLTLVKEFATGQRADTGIVLADIDNDGKLEALLITKNGANGYVYALNLENGSYVNSNWGGNMVITLPNGNNEGHIIPRMAVGDLNRNGNLEVIFGSRNKLYALDKNGVLLAGFPVDIDDMRDTAPVLADIDQDDTIEIIVNSGGTIRAFKYDGSESIGWGLQPNDPEADFVGTPYVGDINNNGKSEVIAGSSKAVTYVWESLGDADKVEWGSYRANAQNTGVYREECTFKSEESVEVLGFLSTIWEEDKHIQGDLIVKANANLTIKSKISFTKKGKLIIEPGAKLIVDGGELNSSCGGFWEGVKVLGNKNLPQTASNQGTIELKNNATIKHAKIAISAGNHPLSRGVSNPISGGIVKIDDAIFTDNILGVLISDYSYQNNSYIQNSHFETTSFMADIDVHPNRFVYLWKISPINILNNTFINHNPLGPVNVPLPSNQGKGIVLHDTGSNIKENLFENLYSAIEVQGTGISFINPLLTINENIFNVNWNAVYLNNFYGAKITSNEVNVHSAFVDGNGLNSPSGLYIANSNGFHIEANSFQSSMEQTYSTGIFIRDCKSANVIYRNEFSDLFTGIYAYGKNTVQNPDIDEITEGLVFSCNEFNNYVTAIYVAPNSFIAPFQEGQNNDTAGNVFNDDCYDFVSNSHQIYYLAENSPQYVPDCNINVNIFYSQLQNPCSSTLNGFGSISDKSTIENNIEDLKIDYMILTDGGDTEDLHEEIEETEPENALALRNTLLSESPFLSDTIMVKATTVEDVLPSIMLKEVLSANPKSAKSLKIQHALENRQNPLPGYMLDEINMGRDSLSLKENLEGKISSLIHKRENLINNLIDSLMNDASGVSMVLLEDLLVDEAQKRIQRSYQLIDFYLSNADFQQAQSVLNEMPNNFGFSVAEQNEYNKFSQLFDIKLALNNANKNWSELSEEQESTIYTLALDSTSIAGMQSRAVLSLINDVDYGFPIPAIEDLENRSTATELVSETFMIYPQLPNNYFIVDYALADHEWADEVDIVIFDNNGTEVKKLDVLTRANQFLIECKDWEEGTYWAKKITAGYIGSEEKIIINRGSLSETDLNEIQITDNLVIYPIPAKEYFFVRCSNYNKNLRLQISSSSGAMIKSLRIESEITKIETESWSNGIYYVSLMENNKVVNTVKIIVAN